MPRSLSSLPADLGDLEFRTVRGTVEQETLCGTEVRSSGATHTRELWVRELGGGGWRLKASVDVAAARRGHRVEALYVVRGTRNLLLRFRNLDTGRDAIEHGTVAAMAGRTASDPAVLVCGSYVALLWLAGGLETAARLAASIGDSAAVALLLLVLGGGVAAIVHVARLRTRVRRRHRLLLERAHAYGPQEAAAFPE